MLLPSYVEVGRVPLEGMYLVVGYSPWAFSAILIPWSVHVVPRGSVYVYTGVLLLGRVSTLPIMSTRTTCSLHVSCDMFGKGYCVVCLLNPLLIIRSTTCTIGIWGFGTSSSCFIISVMSSLFGGKCISLDTYNNIFAQRR